MNKLLYILLLFSSSLIAQTVYIDPDWSGAENGTESEPFNDWDNDITFADNTTYLQKRGTEITNNSDILIEQKDGVSLGAYGEGARPIINRLTSYVIVVSISSNTTISDLDIRGDIENTTAGIHVSGYYLDNGEVSNNTNIHNCSFSFMYNGIRALKYATNIDTIGIYNCTIHDILSDGCYLTDLDSINVIGTHFYNINMGWHIVSGGHSQDISAGDCIQIGGTCSSFTLRGNTFDRRYTGNKFCVIYNTGGAQFDGYGLIEWNTFYPPKDTAGDDGGSCLYLKHANKIVINNNKFIGRGYPGGGDDGESLAHIEVDTVEFAYNMIDNVDFMNLALVLDTAILKNNTFTKDNGTNSMVFNNGNPVLSENNVFALNTGMTAIENNSGTITSITDHIIIGSSSTWGTNPGFVDYTVQNFRPKELSSYLTDQGTNYSGYALDLDSVSVPQNTDRDIGAYEYDIGGGNPPVADFSADDLTPYIDVSVTFTDLSTNNPTSWAWVFDPATVTYTSGSSSSENPEVEFDVADSYTVTLTATNGDGEDDEVKTDYITASEVPAPVSGTRNVSSGGFRLTLKDKSLKHGAGEEAAYDNSKYIEFGGTDEFLSFSEINLGTVHSINCWFNWTTQWLPVFGKTSSSTNWVAIKQNGNINYVNNNSSGVVIVNISLDNNWHMLTITRNGTSVDFYVDKVQVGTTQTLSVNADLIVQYVGKFSSLIIGATNKLDEIYINSGILSVGDMTTLYGGGTPQTAGDPLGLSNGLFFINFEVDVIPTITDLIGSVVLTAQNMEEIDIKSY